MKRITKIFFRHPICPDPRGFSGNGVIIYTETAQEFNAKNNSITLNQGWTIKTGGEVGWIEKSKNPDIRSFIHLKKILKIETTFEERPPSPK